MTIKTQITDGRGANSRACVTARGELAVNDIEYSIAYSVDATSINTAYNFIGPISGKRFVIKGLTVSADKNVGVNGAEVIIYETSSATSTTVDKQLFKLAIPTKTIFGKQTNIITTEGKWISVKHDDNNIYATLEGYYVDA